MLKQLGQVDLPRHASGGGFDHGDVHLESGRIFVAHTANNTIEIIDGERLRHLTTISDCDEASGVLCAQEEHLVFAASRGTGRILAIDAVTAEVSGLTAGSKPNGLAWDTRRKRLLAADVSDSSARIVDPHSKQLLSTIRLLGRPRWCVYDSRFDEFLLNIRDPSGIQTISAESMKEERFLPVSVGGAHGLDIARGEDRAFVACDGGDVVVLDLKTGKEIAVIPIAGEPDAIWFNAGKERLYCAIGRPGVVDVLDTSGKVVAEQIKTEEGAHTTVFDQARQRLYVFLPKSCRASAYEEEEEEE